MTVWLQSAAGGLLIGASASGLLWLTGRVAGISGIVGRLPFAAGGDRAWRWLFLLGLLGGARLAFELLGQPANTREHFPAWLLVIAGLLVGYGTATSGGCTSGHGVCGMARLSLRSFVATVVFLLTGIATTFVVRHLLHVG
jgi:uncharacterized membrane protein YedE/YeeE